MSNEWAYYHDFLAQEEEKEEEEEEEIGQLGDAQRASRQ